MFNPNAAVFTPGNIRHGKSKLLALPVELLQRIVDFALRPSTAYELGRPFSDPRGRGMHPHQSLTAWLRPFKACKALYKMAVGIFFRNNRLNIVVGRDVEKDDELLYGSDNNDNTDAYTGEILHGTFEEHPFFFEHTIKLRVELEGFGDDNIAMICAILASCSALQDVRVCVLNLDTDRERVAFYNAVVDTINALMARSGRRILLAKETDEQYAAEMAARSELQAEYERLEEEQGRALREWMQSGDGESFEEYMNAPSFEEYGGADWL